MPDSVDVLVLGDCMLDRTVRGEASRVAPEGPVPVLRDATVTYAPGGAANVAANAASLGARVALVSAVGDDRAEQRLGRCLRRYKKLHYLCYGDPGAVTTVKTRLYAGNHLVARYDRDGVASPSVDYVLRVIDRLRPKVLALSDYGKGALLSTMLRAVIDRANQLGCVVLVDPKSEDWSCYRGAHLIKPNLAEAFEANDRPWYTYQHNPDGVAALGYSLRDRWSISQVVITCGAQGMVLCREEAGVPRHYYAPAFRPQQVFDVTGAGDTATAALAVRLAAGDGPEAALRYACVASGLVVGKPGTATVSEEEVRAAIEVASPDRKCLSDLRAVRSWAAAQRAQGKRICFTNGTFDLLHRGHLALFAWCRQQADCLLVGTDTDAGIRRLKGAGRPVMSQEHRTAFLAALTHVDAVALFDNNDPRALVEAVQPDVLVKGAQYDGTVVPGSECLDAWGGVLRYAPMLADHSSSSLLARIRDCDGDACTLSSV